MKKPAEVKEKHFSAAIVMGSFSNLALLDFSALGVRCYNLKKNTRKLKTLSNQFKPVFEDYYSIFNIIKKDAERTHENHEYLHVLLPADIRKPVPKSVYYRIVAMLTIAFPTDLQIQTVADFYLNGDQVEWQGSSFYNTHFYPERYKNYLYFQEKPEQIKSINDFLVKCFARVDKAPFLKIAIDAYLNSFGEIPLHMAYLSLCIALESFVSGKSELIYRIKRTVALVCADNLFVAQRIVKNLDKIYALRSSIVHGESYKYEQVEEYQPYLRSLISRTIVELVHTDFTKAEDLQAKLTFAGFTDRSEIFEKNIKYLNLKSYADTLAEELTTKK